MVWYWNKIGLNKHNAVRCRYENEKEKNKENKKKKKRRNECMSIGSVHFMSWIKMFIINFAAFCPLAHSLHCCSLHRSLSGYTIEWTQANSIQSAQRDNVRPHKLANARTGNLCKITSACPAYSVRCFSLLSIFSRAWAQKLSSREAPRRFIITFQWLASWAEVLS